MDIVDTDLLARFRENRDERAFADLVARHQVLVQSACRRVLNDPSAVDDVVQETFWRLAEHADEISTSLSGWLHATATRLAIDWLRRDRRGGRLIGSSSTLPAAAPAAVGAPDEVCRHVLDAVEDLPAPERDLIVRHYLLGATLASLSAVTGTPATTIHRRLHQGLTSLRESLRRRGVETSLGCSLLLLIAGSPWPRPAVGAVAPGAHTGPAPAAGSRARAWRRAAALVALILGILALLLGRSPSTEDGTDADPKAIAGVWVSAPHLLVEPDHGGGGTASPSGILRDPEFIGLNGGWYRMEGARLGMDDRVPLPSITRSGAGMIPPGDSGERPVSPLGLGSDVPHAGLNGGFTIPDDEFNRSRRSRSTNPAGLPLVEVSDPASPGGSSAVTDSVQPVQVTLRMSGEAVRGVPVP